MLVQQYLREGSLDSEKILSIDWTNNMMDLGFILGISDKTKIDSKVFQVISSNIRLNNSIRIVSIKRSMESLLPEIEKVIETNKEMCASLIEKFDLICSPISQLKPNLGLLKDTISQTFTLVFKAIVEKCALSGKVTILGLIAHKNSELLNLSCNLTLLTIEELEKLDRHKEISVSESLPIIGKSFEIIHSNKIPPKDVLSILTYNTFSDIMKLPVIIENDVQTIQKFLNEYKDNFTNKQKFSLLKSYTIICKKQGLTPDEGIIKEYEDKKEENKLKDEQWVNINKISFKEEKKVEGENREKNVETNPRVYENKSKKDLGEQVEEGFNQIYYSLEADIKNKKKIEVDELSERLYVVFNISPGILYETIEYYSGIEEKSPTTSLLWRLISKAIKRKNIFRNHEQFSINRNIDRLVDKPRHNSKY